MSSPAAPEASIVRPPAAPAIKGYSAEIAEALAHPRWFHGETRMAVVRRGAVRLRVEGPDLGLRDQAPFSSPERLRVVDDGERPRVVHVEGGVRLLLHVDRGDARPVVARASALRRSPTEIIADPPRRGHAVLQPGAFVDVVAREGAMARVDYHEGERLRGWIEADALATTATLVKPAVDERPNYHTLRATELRARPDGAALTRIDGAERVIEVTPRVTSGHRLVEYRPPCHPDYVYIGFVPAGDLHEPRYGSKFGCGSGLPGIERSFGEFEAAPRATIAAGRFLIDPDRPEIVGCVDAPVELADLGEGLYAAATIWGPVPVRLAPADFAGSCGE